jgi:hypothetical protein
MAAWRKSNAVYYLDTKPIIEIRGPYANLWIGGSGGIFCDNFAPGLHRPRLAWQSVAAYSSPSRPLAYEIGWIMPNRPVIVKELTLASLDKLKGV